MFPEAVIDNLPSLVTDVLNPYPDNKSLKSFTVEILFKSRFITEVMPSCTIFILPPVIPKSESCVVSDIVVPLWAPRFVDVVVEAYEVVVVYSSVPRALNKKSANPPVILVLSPNDVIFNFRYPEDEA